MSTYRTNASPPGLGHCYSPSPITFCKLYQDSFSASLKCLVFQSELPNCQAGLLYCQTGLLYCQSILIIVSHEPVLLSFRLIVLDRGCVKANNQPNLFIFISCSFYTSFEWYGWTSFVFACFHLLLFPLVFGFLIWHLWGCRLLSDSCPFFCP